MMLFQWHKHFHCFCLDYEQLRLSAIVMTTALWVRLSADNKLQLFLHGSYNNKVKHKMDSSGFVQITTTLDITTKCAYLQSQRTVFAIF